MPTFKLPVKILCIIILIIVEAIAFGLFSSDIIEADYSNPLVLIVAVCLIVAIVFQMYYTHRLVSDVLKSERELQQANSNAFLICHRDPENSFTFLGKQFTFCARCSGFYMGLVILSLLTFLDNKLWMDMINYFGLNYYKIITVLSILSVPIHGTLTRRFQIKQQRFIRFIIGFYFSSSIFLLGNLMVNLLT